MEIPVKYRHIMRAETLWTVRGFDYETFQDLTFFLARNTDIPFMQICEMMRRLLPQRMILYLTIPIPTFCRLVIALLNRKIVLDEQAMVVPIAEYVKYLQMLRDTMNTECQLTNFEVSEVNFHLRRNLQLLGIKISVFDLGFREKYFVRANPVADEELVRGGSASAYFMHYDYIVYNFAAYMLSVCLSDGLLKLRENKKESNIARYFRIMQALPIELQAEVAVHGQVRSDEFKLAFWLYF